MTEQIISNYEIEDLFLETLTEDSEHEIWWNALQSLRDIGNRHVFEFASAWCRCDNELRQLTGIDVLSQLGRTFEHPITAFRDESFPLLRELLQSRPPSVSITCSLLNAMNFLAYPDAIPLICSYASDAIDEIRLNVAFCLGHPLTNHPQSVVTLLELMNDQIDRIRDWSTFALGVCIELDWPELRDQFVKRLNDSDKETREEAICALVRRKDPRVIKPLIEEMKAGPLSCCDEKSFHELLYIPVEEQDLDHEEMLERLIERFGE